ncbi:MAG TPA: AbgT family transporter [Candidatus Enterocloster faecavium]|uniref:AbgT family transporter n=1 Tax=Candidatus Enterocloster faecavium TaxID=2838560 RepID=A0A9D2L6C4_9FIRM|nr:AbgT family transporter [Candidatus Enterocloster faecavium]
MGRLKEKLARFHMPHTYVILTIILLITAALTYVIPAGEYERVLDAASGRMVVIPDSFHYTEGVRPGFFDIFLALQRGYVSAADILFLILFAYGYIYILTENGTLSQMIQVLIRRLGDRTHLLIPVCMLVFGILGSTMGIFEEVYGLIPVFGGIAVGLGYDVMLGGAIVYVGVATGFAAATTNPFSVGIAESIAQLPAMSGLGYRIFCFVIFQTVSIIYVMWYGARIKAHPEKSVMYGVATDTPPMPEISGDGMSLRQKLSLLLFAATIGMLLYGTTRLGWYIDEIAALFLMMMIITGIVGGYSATEICKSFIRSTQSMVSSVLVIGFTRGILLVMQDAQISDTVVYYLSQLLDGSSKSLSAVGMLVIQNIINFFITGSSSQATITMPIMAPVADLVGLSRQTAVLAYIFGDGFSDLFWPTACILGCGLMGVPVNKWYRFITPLFVMMAVLQTILTAASVWVYG